MLSQRKYLSRNEKFTGVIFEPDPIQETEYLKILNNREEIKKLDEARAESIKNFKPKIIRRRASESSTNSG